MNKVKEFPTTPEPAPEQPSPTPAPEQPKRRRYTQPIFRYVRGTMMAGALLIVASVAQAQTDSTRTTSPGRNQTGTGTGTGTGTQTGTSTGTQTQAQSQRGWTMFDDRIGKEYNLTADQMRRLRDVDARYMNEYKGLGNDPMNNPGYQSLTDRRNREVRTVLGDDTYGRWEKRYGGSMGQQGQQKNPGGTNTGGNNTGGSNTGGNNTGGGGTTTPPTRK